MAENENKSNKDSIVKPHFRNKKATKGKLLLKDNTHNKIVNRNNRNLNLNDPKEQDDNNDENINKENEQNNNEVNEVINAGKEKVKQEIKATIRRKILLFILSNPAVIVFLLSMIFIIIMVAANTDASADDGTSVSSSNKYAINGKVVEKDGYPYSGNLQTFLSNLEGSTTLCNDGNGYTAENLGDGTITVGEGITNMALASNVTKQFIEKNEYQEYFKNNNGTYYLEAGDCVPREIIDQIKVLVIENNYASPIHNYLNVNNRTLYQFQIDAITSFNYNCGTARTNNLLDEYFAGVDSGIENSGEERLWNVMKECQYLQGKELVGLKKRRKAEFALFVTGDYSDQGKFYSRSVEDYDNYDSENVMALKLVLVEELAYDNETFLEPIRGSYRVTSRFGERWGGQHNGIDLGATFGTEVYSIGIGKVIATKNDAKCSYHATEGYYYYTNEETGAKIVDSTGTTCNKDNSTSAGNYVKVDYGKYVGEYYHLKYGSVRVSVGDEVDHNTVLAGVGTTGYSTGHHLHFGIRDAEGGHVNPEEIITFKENG